MRLLYMRARGKSDNGPVASTTLRRNVEGIFRAKTSLIRPDVSVEHRLVTDRQTDRQTRGGS